MLKLRHTNEFFLIWKVRNESLRLSGAYQLFSLRKKLQKSKNPCRIYRALSVLLKSPKERASPRRDVYFVPRKHSAEPRGEKALHLFFMVCERAIGSDLIIILAFLRKLRLNILRSNLNRDHENL